MKSKNCECCMMPLAKDPRKSGSKIYCSNCFSHGKLLAKGMTLKEFQKRAYTGMVKAGNNKMIAWLFSKMIAFAPYWNKKKVK